MEFTRLMCENNANYVLIRPSTRVKRKRLHNVGVTACQ